LWRLGHNTEVFPLKGYTPIFAYSPHIYNPHRVEIGPELLEHEAVHGFRQGNDPETWWKRYMAEDNFRLAEEVFAHVAEYQYLIRGRDRVGRRRMLDYIVGRLCEPLYGYNPPLSYSRGRGILKWALREQQKAAG
jgi:hypothetical protein